jgi:hypothetical protein
METLKILGIFTTNHTKEENCFRFMILDFVKQSKNLKASSKNYRPKQQTQQN